MCASEDEEIKTYLTPFKKFSILMDVTWILIIAISTSPVVRTQEEMQPGITATIAYFAVNPP